MASMCLREAISGTTPPYLLWTAIWEAMTFDSMMRPSRTTAAAVSSQDVSMAKTSMIMFSLRFSFTIRPGDYIEVA